MGICQPWDLEPNWHGCSSGLDLIESVWGVDGVEFFRGILSGVLQDDFGAAGVLREEFGHVIDFPMNDNPARVSVVVLCHILTSQFGVHFFVLSCAIAIDKLE